MYGINKLYSEQLGKYYAIYYRQLDAETPRGRLDFRGLRFPGLISADTVPTGGTSDFAPEILHHAAQRKPYACFVRPDTKISFMAKPDAIKSLLMLTEAPKPNLSRVVYNVAAFALTAGGFRDRALRAFPGAHISFEPNPRRQGIVDSWPEDVDDSLARRDWGWKPDYDEEAFFDDYFLPQIRKRYGSAPNPPTS
jgi:threonine 3-dehydrogenase